MREPRSTVKASPDIQRHVKFPDRRIWVSEDDHRSSEVPPHPLGLKSGTGPGCDCEFGSHDVRSCSGLPHGRLPGPVGAKPRPLNDPLEDTQARTAAGRKRMLGLFTRPGNGQISSNTAASYM